MRPVTTSDTPTKWDRRFLELAALVATWSKDPSTRVGAVIADHKNRIISVGCNGFPRGVSDASVSRDEKLRRTIHAEENALLFARGPVEGYTLYVTHYPCARCASKIIQSGIRKIVVPLQDYAFMERWLEEMTSATRMFQESGASLTIYTDNN